MVCFVFAVKFYWEQNGQVLGQSPPSTYQTRSHLFDLGRQIPFESYCISQHWAIRVIRTVLAQNVSRHVLVLVTPAYQIRSTTNSQGYRSHSSYTNHRWFISHPLYAVSIQKKPLYKSRHSVQIGQSDRVFAQNMWGTVRSDFRHPPRLSYKYVSRVWRTPVGYFLCSSFFGLDRVCNHRSDNSDVRTLFYFKFCFIKIATNSLKTAISSRLFVTLSYLLYCKILINSLWSDRHLIFAFTWLLCSSGYGRKGVIYNLSTAGTHF